jgi:hypothetical protein
MRPGMIRTPQAKKIKSTNASFASQKNRQLQKVHFFLHYLNTID